MHGKISEAGGVRDVYTIRQGFRSKSSPTEEKANGERFPMKNLPETKGINTAPPSATVLLRHIAASTAALH